MASILLSRDYSEAGLRVETRNFVGWRTADNDELGLVRHAISFKYPNHFTSRFFSLTSMILGYLKRRLEVEHGYVESFFYRGF